VKRAAAASRADPPALRSVSGPTPTRGPGAAPSPGEVVAGEVEGGVAEDLIPAFPPVPPELTKIGSRTVAPRSVVKSAGLQLLETELPLDEPTCWPIVLVVWQVPGSASRRRRSSSSARSRRRQHRHRSAAAHVRCTSRRHRRRWGRAPSAGPSTAHHHRDGSALVLHRPHE
jgi:hypothetical protein